MKKRASLPALEASQSWWLLGAAVMALLPLAPHLPTWLTAAAAATFGLRAGLIAFRQAAPSRWVLGLAVVAGTIGVLVQYRTLFGQHPGIALLVVLFALKQIESGARRDGLAIVLLCYFLALAKLFYSQTIPAAATLSIVVVVATAALGSLADGRLGPRRRLRLTALLLAQATPFMLILFVLFPRVSGPLWGLPRDAYSALTGLSDSMAPGSIGRLSQSDAIAFRARFSGPPPPRSQLYWRGPVLTQFDGTTWRPGFFSLGSRLPYAPDSRRVDYEVTLEPHNRHWLFALELPAYLPQDSFIASDYQLLARTPVVERRRYAVASRPGQQAGDTEAAHVLMRASALPAGRNPRTLALGRDWRARHADNAAIVDAALAFFVRQRLVYTLEPPLLLGEHSVDEFLFDTRRGFCEHFAGAFVVALRAAGVPARVVTGYQGGEINPVDGYMIVRQSDAHAWTEAWLDERGWTRIDPTAASFPNRIELNLAAAVPAGDPLPLLLRADWNWLRDARARWEAIANGWNQRILGYTPQRQREFLAGLGMRSPDWRSMTVALTVLCALVVLALALWALRQHRRLDAAQALWLRATARLARRGLPRRPWEGPHDYAARVAAARPDLAAAILDIAQLYGRVRYGSIGATDLLRRRIASFRP